MKDFPLNTTKLVAVDYAVFPTAIPTGGPIIRVSRETNDTRAFIAFGGSTLANGSDTSMELLSGDIEELENPDPVAYTHFVVSAMNGTCEVSVSCGAKRL